MAAGGSIEADLLRTYVAHLFTAAGLPPADAGTVADVLCWADLRGVELHGVERVPRYIELLAQGVMDAAAKPLVRDVAGAAFAIDARKAPGQVAMMLAMREAERRARQSGVALGLVNRTTHTGAIGYYAEWGARRGFASIVLAAGMPLMAYPGTSAPSISTSPVAIGVPGGASGAIVLDMSTAIAASGRLRKAQLDRQPIPEGWALDAQGRPTTDPAAASVSLPVGGAKGAGLSLMIEILASVLGGAPVVAKQAPAGARKHHTANGLVLLIDIARFRPVQDFVADVDELAGVLKALPRLVGAGDVRMPGERGDAEFRRRSRDGIPLGARLARSLVGLGAELKVETPLALASIAGD